MNNDKIVCFGGSFNPTAIHHRLIAERLTWEFGRVVAIPCGMRPDKASAGLVSANHRAEMALLTFARIPNVVVDLSDVANEDFARTYDLDLKMKARYGDNVWHAIGTDLVTGGARGESEIQRRWYKGQELWNKANFIVMSRSGSRAGDEDLPPHSEVLIVDFPGSSTEIRNRLARGESIEGLVTPTVERYILENKLYTSKRSGG
ncbi:nicotinate-nicotinamide nucleotide adenylyltransferase [Candidatus Kuenenbacteria bacterium]|nr:nicotinate-nicotinamide nucleotide adenylyltransferase [Candidatus Kuenenbacteria bacterium]